MLRWAMSDCELETATQQEPTPPTGTVYGFKLTVVEGADQGAFLTIDGRQPSRALVGQSPVCALRLADRRVSRRHFAAELSTDGLSVTDTSSTNGTFVNEVRVRDAILHGGETVRVGETTIRVDVSGPLRGG
jgi:pSer/pThr/pTyr-binding forkhead associated (FHA) protein